VLEKRSRSSIFIPSGFGSVVAYADLDGEVRVRVRVIPKTLKMVLTAPQPVLVIMSLSKRNTLAIKKAQIIPYTMDLQTKVV
jgi:hypothetical protein